MTNNNSNGNGMKKAKYLTKLDRSKQKINDFE